MTKPYIEGLKILAQFPIGNAWMLPVDGKFWVKEKGPLGFDTREPGSVEGAIKGLVEAITDIEEDLSVAKIHKVHKACIEGIKTKNPNPTPGRFRETFVTFGIQPGWASLAGLKQFVVTEKSTRGDVVPTKLEDGQTIFQIEWALTKDSDIDKIFPKMQKEICAVYAPPGPSVIPERMEQTIARYNGKIKESQEKDEKDQKSKQIEREPIILAIQEFTRTHPYRDGNNRCLVTAELNAQLVRHGMAPGIFWDPNVFELHKEEELLTLVKEAQQRTQIIIANPDAEVFGFKNSTLLKDPAHKAKYEAIGKLLLTGVRDEFTKLASRLMKKVDYEDAMECFTQCLQLHIKLNGDKNKYAAVCYRNLAAVALKLNQKQQAKCYYVQALQVYGNLKQDAALEKEMKEVREKIAGLTAKGDQNSLEQIPAASSGGEKVGNWSPAVFKPGGAEVSSAAPSAVALVLPLTDSIVSPQPSLGAAMK